MGGEKGLWRAVIIQAAQDLASLDDEVRSAAYCWFVFARHDYTEVCRLAGVDPARTRALALGERRPK